VKILVVHNRYRSSAPSGENRVVDQESSALVARGHTVEHFERRSDDIERWGMARRAMLPITVVWNEEARRSLTRVLRKLRPDVVHVHNTFPLIGASALTSCWDERVPAVVTVHNYRLLCASGDLFRDGLPCHDCIGKAIPISGVVHRCYRRSAASTLPITLEMATHRKAWRTRVSAYIFISQAQQRLHSGLRLPPERIFVKTNLVPSTISPANVSGREPLVAYLGRLDAAKGVPLLMEAWDRFRASKPDSSLRLVVAGGGILGQVASTWADGHPSVNTVGILNGEQCAALLARCRAVIVPSQWEETFGLVAVEAMAAGVPTLATSHGSFPELINDGVDGVLFAPQDVDGLVALLRDVDEHPSRWETYGERARRTYQEHFDPEENMDQLSRIYRFAMDHPIWADRSPTAYKVGADR